MIMGWLLDGFAFLFVCDFLWCAVRGGELHWQAKTSRTRNATPQR